MDKKRKRNREKEKISSAIWRLNNKEKLANIKREWRKQNPEKVKAQKRRSWHKHKHSIDRRERSKRNKLKKNYGITLEFYNEEIDRNGNRCACCSREFIGNFKPHVDHCHDTGMVRGIICMNCNVAEGLLRENPKLFEQLQKYLKEKNNELSK